MAGPASMRYLGFRSTRRRLIASAAAAVAMSGALFAQSPDRRRRVLILLQAAPERGELLRKQLVERLRARGWYEGRNLLLEVRYARVDGQDLPKFAAESVGASPDVIMVTGSPLAAAVKSTGTTVPCVFVAVYDPIGLGLVESLARPGATFTGVSNAVPEGFVGKQIELLREAVPDLKRIALLTDSRYPIDRANRLKAARDLGLEAIEVHAATREELEPAFREAARRGATGMIAGGLPLTMANRALVAELALRHRQPTMFLFDANVLAGGLMSYGADMADLQRRGADYVDRILRGAKPVDMPIEQPTKFALVINLNTAKALGITIPPSVLLRADRLIE